MQKGNKKSIDLTNNFDFFRFFAASLVWYSHCYALTGKQDNLANFSGFESFGKIGVAIFFIISGYFITASFYNRKQILPFIINRILRIFPALIVLVLLSVFVIGAIYTRLNLYDYFTNKETWTYLKIIQIFPQYYNLPGVFLDNPANPPIIAVNGSLWTLKYELKFYIAVALLGVLGILQPRLILALFISLFAIRIYGATTEPEMIFGMKWGGFNLTLTLASLFAGGAIMFLWKEKIKLDKWLFILAAFSFYISIFLPPSFSAILWNFSLIYIVIYLGFLRIPLLHKFGNWGDFSYGMYLYAFPMQQISLQILGKNPNFSHFLILSFDLTLVCAVLSWLFIEKPALRFKR
ncbi:MAG: acyltransferase [Pseudomonadota bacterium]